jgi:ribose transport system substrate-binding protein
MKKKRITLVLSLVLALMMVIFTGCQEAATTPSTAPSTAPSVAPTEAPSVAPTEAPSTAPTEETIDLSQHEVYTYSADNAFGGTTQSVYKDRSSINKALPVTAKKDLVIGWAAPSLGNTYFAGIQTGAQERCDEYGYTLKFTVADNFDAVKQSANIEALVTAGVDIMVVDPVDTQAQLLDVQRVVDAGIPVIASGVPFDQSAPVITTVVSSNYEGGYVTGQYCANYYKDPIKVGMIMGTIGHPVSNSRLNGFLAGWIYTKQQTAGTAKPYREDAMLEGYNAYKDLVANGKLDLSADYGMNIVGCGQGLWDETAGMTAAEDMLTANPDISLIFAENDHMGTGTAKVLAQEGLTDKIKIACAADGDKYGLENVRDGVLMTTGYNNSVCISHRVIDLCKMIFEEGYDANNMPIVTPLPMDGAVTIDNYAQYYDPDSDYAKEIDVPFYTIDELNAANK